MNFPSLIQFQVVSMQTVSTFMSYKVNVFLSYLILYLAICVQMHEINWHGSQWISRIEQNMPTSESSVQCWYVQTTPNNNVWCIEMHYAHKWIKPNHRSASPNPQWKNQQRDKYMSISSISVQTHVPLASIKFPVATFMRMTNLPWNVLVLLLTWDVIAVFQEHCDLWVSVCSHPSPLSHC